MGVAEIVKTSVSKQVFTKHALCLECSDESKYSGAC